MMSSQQIHSHIHKGVVATCNQRVCDTEISLCSNCACKNVF